jgi:hypothetical protein
MSAIFSDALKTQKATSVAFNTVFTALLLDALGVSFHGFFMSHLGAFFGHF